MPSMYLHIPKMDKEVKETLVAKLYGATAAVIKGPDIGTYVTEYETVYKNGLPCQAPTMNVVNLEAGPMPVEKIEQIGAGMAQAVKDVLGEEQELTFVYHANGLDHIAVNGKLIKK